MGEKKEVDLLDDAEEESVNIVKDVVGGLKSFINERLVSPLLPAFVVAWLYWNYKVVLTVLSGISLDEKFSKIDSFFPGTWGHINNGFLFPLAIALAYIFVYPLVSIPVYAYAVRKRADLRNSRQKAEKNVVLNEADKQKLLSQLYESKLEWRRREDELRDEIELLKASLAESQKALATFRETAKNQLEMADYFKSKELNSDQVRILKYLSEAENQGVEKVPEKKLASALKMKPTDLKRELGELLSHGRVIQLVESGIGLFLYSLNNEGRKALKDYQDKLLLVS